MKIRFAVSIMLISSFAAPILCAEEPIKASADVEALFKDNDKNLNEMKQVAYHIEKDLLQCNHWDEADKWLTERYIQHNPPVASGRAGVVKFLWKPS